MNTSNIKGVIASMVMISLAGFGMYWANGKILSSIEQATTELNAEDVSAPARRSFPARKKDRHPLRPTFTIDPEHDPLAPVKRVKRPSAKRPAATPPARPYSEQREILLQ